MLAAISYIENPEVLFHLWGWGQADRSAIARNEAEALPCPGRTRFDMCGYDLIQLKKEAELYLIAGY